MTTKFETIDEAMEYAKEMFEMGYNINMFKEEEKFVVSLRYYNE